MKRVKNSRVPVRTIAAIMAIVSGLVVLGALILPGKSMDVLQPAGVVAQHERGLLIFTLVLGMAVVLPVFTLLFTFAWKYREGNHAPHEPEQKDNHTLELVWWGIPFIIITILGVVTWVTTHTLDPYRPLAGTQPPLEVQVVSLNWKWLFIYPEQRVASLNELYIPVDRPIHFTLTADSPMTTMWVPRLGSQIYAMKGMSTQLNLMATSEGVYRGSNTNISGEGYADMDFMVYAVSRGAWNVWLKAAEHGEVLDRLRYDTLARPSRHDIPQQFALAAPGLYNEVMMKYMGHGGLGVDAAQNNYAPIDHSAHGGMH